MMVQERLVSLQILRFLAAAGVVAYHTPPLILAATGVAPANGFYDAIRSGAAGVDVFFVLSGFVIALTGPFAEPRPSGALFFWRRWRRVAPFYFIVSAIPIGHALGDLSADRLVATFLFWPAPGPKLIGPYLEVGWTLSFEMAFYSAVALVLTGGMAKRNIIIAAAIGVVLIICRALFTWDGFRFLASPLFLEFGLGVALASIRHRLVRAGLWTGGLLLALGLGAFAFEAILGMGDIGDVGGEPFYGHDLRRIFLFGIPAAGVVAGAIMCERSCRGRAAGLVARGGDASYAIYLTHMLALSLIATGWRYLHGPMSPLLLVAMAVAGATAVGLLTHYVVERPILRDLKRLRWPQPAGATGAPAD